MAKEKLDGVIEAVRYHPDGQVDWVRAYLRRGPTFSDYVQLKRDRLVADLKAGKRFYTGRRIPLMASTFETERLIHLSQVGEKVFLVTDPSPTNQDHLEGVPVL